jgi:hypothetical protein
LVQIVAVLLDSGADPEQASNCCVGREVQAVKSFITASEYGDMSCNAWETAVVHSSKEALEVLRTKRSVSGPASVDGGARHRSGVHDSTGGGRACRPFPGLLAETSTSVLSTT